MKVYITKYALTKGILRGEVELCSCDNTMVKISNNGNFAGYFLANEWYKEKKDAIKHAEIMKIKKIEALRRKIDKLSRMEFK